MPPPAFMFRGGRGGGRGRSQHQFTFRAPPPKTAARPLLTSMREKTPEFMGGASGGDQELPTKFLALDDVTDSDEAEMDVSSAEEGEPPRKRLATDVAVSVMAANCQWSNPDPYTVLPPIDEPVGKRKDFVKMIRKAKNAAAQQKAEESNPVVANDDFISFGDLDFDVPEPPANAPANAPRGPRNTRNPHSDPALGNRKRTHDDEIIAPATQSDLIFPHDNAIIDMLYPVPGQDSTPWIDRSATRTLHLGTMLHNEVLDFYHWVRPHPFEHIVREDLISRLNAVFQRRHWGSELHAFGSFASGLYLPIADMDLVLLSRSFVCTGEKAIGSRKQVFQLAAFIKNSGIAVPGSVEPIPFARVPIIKFKDRVTGLRVDLSFDNTTGIVANRTFLLWKNQFPAMPIIVSVIKQFLLLRGLNEVHSGGLGGFSIICLVTSLLQHLPHGAAEPNLGSVLMDFFDLYGTKFDFRSVGIRMDPPGYFNKASEGVYRADQKQRLAIMDPNNQSNDVSGGTREIGRIFNSFGDAFGRLKQNLASTAFEPSKNAYSILGSILGANYESYEVQRQQLREVFHSDPIFAQYWAPPPPPPIDSPPPPPSPPRGEANPTAVGKSMPYPEIDVAKLSKKQLNSFERANRLRSLRPDLTSVPDLVTVEQAVEIGGYAHQSEMDRDLYAREKPTKPRSKGNAK